MTCGLRNYWRELFQRMYGATFVFWQFEIERDRVGNTLEFEFVLLGLGLWLCFSLGPISPQLREALAASRPGGAQKEPTDV